MHLNEIIAELRAERDKLKERLRKTCQILVAEFGADGPASAEESAERAVSKHRDLRAERDRLAEQVERMQKALKNLRTELHGNSTCAVRAIIADALAEKGTTDGN